LIREGLLGRDAWLAQRVIQLRISHAILAGRWQAGMRDADSERNPNVNENYSYYSVRLRDMQECDVVNEHGHRTDAVAVQARKRGRYS
jgi:hypothetical protein